MKILFVFTCGAGKVNAIACGSLYLASARRDVLSCTLCAAGSVGGAVLASQCEVVDGAEFFRSRVDLIQFRAWPDSHRGMVRLFTHALKVLYRCAFSLAQRFRAYLVWRAATAMFTCGNYKYADRVGG